MKLPNPILRALKQCRVVVWESAVNYVLKSVGGYMVATGALLTTVLKSIPGLHHPDGSLWPLSTGAMLAVLFTILLAAALWLFAKDRARGRRDDFRNEWFQQQLEHQQKQKRRRRPIEALTEPPLPSSEGLLLDSLKDKKYQRRAFGSLAFYTAGLGILAFTMQRMFAVELTVWARNGFDLTNTMVVVRKGTETIATGTLGSEGIKLFQATFLDGEYEIVVCKVSDGQVFWSQSRVEVTRDRSRLKVVGFPQYAHKQVPVPPVTFGVDSSRVGHSCARTILQIQQALIDHVGEIFVAGRADSLEYPVGSSHSNYDLSLKRCMAVVEKLDLVAAETHLVIAPLDNLLPLTHDASNDSERQPDRSVTLIPLLKQNDIKILGQR